MSSDQPQDQQAPEHDDDPGGAGAEADTAAEPEETPEPAQDHGTGPGEPAPEEPPAPPSPGDRPADDAETSAQEKLEALQVISVPGLLRAVPAVLFDPVDGAERSAQHLGQTQGLLEGGILCVATALCSAIPVEGGTGNWLGQYLSSLLWTLLALAILALGLHVYRRMIVQIDSARLGDAVYLTGCFGIPIAVTALVGGILGLVPLAWVAQLFLISVGHVLGILVLYNTLSRHSSASERSAGWAVAILAAVAGLAFAYPRVHGIGINVLF
jgi:hypothetical protein